MAEGRGCEGRRGIEDAQEVEMTRPGTRPRAGVTRREDRRIHRVLRFHTWVEVDGDAPGGMGSPGGKPTRCSSGDVLSLRGQRFVPVKTAGHQEALALWVGAKPELGVQVRTSSQGSWGLRSPSEGGPCWESCGCTNMQEREQRKRRQEAAGEEAVVNQRGERLRV